jgi:hypothetical protein
VLGSVAFPWLLYCRAFPLYREEVQEARCSRGRNHITRAPGCRIYAICGYHQNTARCIPLIAITKALRGLKFVSKLRLKSRRASLLRQVASPLVQPPSTSAHFTLFCLVVRATLYLVAVGPGSLPHRRNTHPAPLQVTIWGSRFYTLSRESRTRITEDQG